MTEKQLQEKTSALGGSIKYPDCLITLPEKLSIKTKAQALDLIDVIIGSWGIRRNGETEETVYVKENEYGALKALRKFLEKRTA